LADGALIVLPNKGHFEAMVKGRAVDDFMRGDLPYPDARAELLTYYRKKRKCNAFAEDLFDPDPLKILLLERDTNKTFNKTVFDDREILNKVIIAKPDLEITGRKGVPMMDGKIPVIANLKVAQGLLENKYEGHVGMLLLFAKSETKSVVSKKSGKPYKMMKVELSDGYNEAEAVMWDRDKPLRFPVDSVVYVVAKLKEGWKAPISLQLEKIERVL
jgi:hypothetical protein